MTNKLIKNLEWKEQVMSNLLHWREDFARLEISHIDIPGNLRKELDGLLRALPVIDMSENHLIDLYRVKYQLFAGKLQQYLREMGEVMGKNKQKFRPQTSRAYNSPRDYNSPDHHFPNYRHGMPASVQERTIAHEREERKPTFSVPSFRNEFKAGPQYQKVKETKCSFSKFSPDVVLTRLAYNKITAWCRLMSDEVTALGIVEQEGEDFIVKDFFMFHQIVSGGTCEARDADALIEVMEEVEKHGYDCSQLRCWWHSHNSMATNPSQQDLKTTEEFAGNSYLISLINNHRGEFNCKINLYRPFELEIADVPLFVQDEGISEAFITERKKEIEKFVRTRGYQSVGFSAGVHQPTLPQIAEDMGLSDHLMNSGYVGQEDNFFVDPEIIKEKLKKGEPPYDACIYESSIRYTWDETTKRYKMYDGQNNELSSTDLKELGAYDYNEEIEELLHEIAEEAKTPTTQEGA